MTRCCVALMSFEPGVLRECGAEVLMPEGYCRNGHRQALADRPITWDTERDRVGCQCVRSDAWRCNSERIALGTGDRGRVSCACECHRYAHRQAAELDRRRPDGPNGAGPKP